MAAVTDSSVMAYEDLVNRLARRYVGFVGAEYDDLRQEGLISVWQALTRGIRPSEGVIDGRLIDWLRFLTRLKHGDAVAYELLLPIEDYRDV